MVTHHPARFFYRLFRDRVISPGRGNNLACRFADPFLPAKRPVLSCAMSKQRDILVKALLVESLSNFAHFQVVKRKISQTVSSQRQFMRAV
jgi:hypothetical protein